MRQDRSMRAERQLTIPPTERYNRRMAFMADRRILWAVSTMAAFLTAWFILYMALNMLILGSGIDPLPMWTMTASMLPLAAGWAVAWPRVRGRWRPVILATMALFTLYLQCNIYGYFIDKGRACAKTRGAQLAYSIRDYHGKQSRWPNDLTELSPATVPFNARDIAPYIYIALDGGHEEKVGGFFLSYKLSEGKPVLTVCSRDVSTTWNWDTMIWQGHR